MSQQLIQKFLNDLSDLRRVSGTHREQVVREAFKTLLKDWGRSRDLIFVPEYEYTTLAKERRYVDGALLHELRVPFGYWEAKDERDDLDAEIEAKRRRGYPDDNIIYEDSNTAVLRQNRQEVMRCELDDVDRLEHLLDLFFGYERAEVAEFRAAVRQFKTDLPAVLDALRDMIAKEHESDAAFRTAEEKFLAHAKETINPTLGQADIREMLIQHILTEEIFARVFDNADFHRQNNVAKELYALEGVFFKGDVKFRTMRALEPYYAAIRSAAALVPTHNEKQAFLKAIYENFYKVYNPKAADRLGVVYTPNEIVRFMIEGADWLCRKHFNRGLIDKDVEILDPAGGTGTFITEMLEFFRGQPGKLRYKYKEELHANEVAILPYYVANLNIEATYAAITGQYAEYENLCFVDTLDNVAGLGIYAGHQHDMFGAMSEENIERIKRQNRKKISVIIGNPPYNANQQNENENNKNRTYRRIDERIKSTYIAASTAQKTKLYDMYARFFRWASDRLLDEGVITFVTNRSFIDKRNYDGFRKRVADDFSEIWVLDLGGDVRANPKISGTKHNVFGIQTGVAISFMVKRKAHRGCTIRYAHRPELETAEEKLAFLDNHRLEVLAFNLVEPDAKSNWINLGERDFGELIPIADKRTKGAKSSSAEKAIFRLFSLGVNTARDEWVYAITGLEVELKVRAFIERYDAIPATAAVVGDSIKWSRNLKRRLSMNRREQFQMGQVRRTVYRPFVSMWLYRSRLYVDELGSVDSMFPPGSTNVAVCFPSGARLAFFAFAVSEPADLNLYSLDPTQCISRYRYSDGNRLDNITDWALE